MCSGSESSLGLPAPCCSILRTPYSLVARSSPLASNQTKSSDRSVLCYQTTVRKEFQFLKRTRCLADWLAKGIALADNAGMLLPVCDLHLNDTASIDTFSIWRKENYFAYPSQFPVTNEGTANWLKGKLLDVEDRILFLVLDSFGNR